MTRSPSMPSYSASVPLILSGAYTDQYGKPILTVALKSSNSAKIAGEKTGVITKNSTQIDEFVRQYLRKKKPLERKKNPHIVIGSKDFFSPTATTAAVMSTLLQYYSPDLFDESLVNSLTYKFLKKKDSGYMTSTSVFGGLIYYRREFESLKTISRLPFVFPKKFEKKLVILIPNMDASVDPRKTIDKRYNISSESAEKILNELEKNTKRMVTSITAEDERLFVKSLETQSFLQQKLRIFSADTRRVMNEIGKSGIVFRSLLDDKQVLIIFIKDKNHFEQTVRRFKFTTIPFEVSYKGIIKE